MPGSDGVGDEGNITGLAHAENSTDDRPSGRRWIKLARLIFAGVLILLGAFLVAQSSDLGYESRGTSGPGFFPFWVGLILAILAALWGISEFRADVDSQIEQDLETRGVMRVARLVIALAVAIILFIPVGYNLTMLALMLFLTFSMGKGNPYVKVVVSLAASFGVYLAFERGLGVTLPDSILPFLSQFGL